MKDKEFDRLSSEDWWWSPELQDEDLAAALVEEVHRIQRDQAWRHTELLSCYGLYEGVELRGLTESDRLSVASFLPANSPVGGLGPGAALGGGFVMNVTRSVVDGAHNKIASRRPKPSFIVEGDDGQQEAVAYDLDRLVRGVFQRERAYDRGKKALLHAMVFGTGFLKVVELQDRVRIECVRPDRVLVDDCEGEDGCPRTLYQVGTVHRSLLGKLYPDQRESILAAETVSAEGEEGHVRTELVEVVEGWRLPSHPGAGDGRHVMAIVGAKLVDEAWEDEDFPFVPIYWEDPAVGYWGRGIPSILRDTQVYLNRLVWRIHEAIRRFGKPHLVVSGKTKVDTKESDVTRVPEGSRPPEVHFPDRVMGDEVYRLVAELKTWMFEQQGVSEMVATGNKPTGLYSGEAIRRWSDQASERFADVVGNYEQLYVRVAEQVVRAGKRIARREGSYRVRLSEGTFVHTLDFKDVDIDRVYSPKVFPTAQLPSTVSGKLETLELLRSQGMISNEVYADNLDIPDVQEVVALKNAPMDNAKRRLNRMLRTLEYEPPDELDDLASVIKLVTQSYHLLAVRDVPDRERGQDLCRQFLSQAVSMMQAPPPPQPGPAGPPADQNPAGRPPPSQPTDSATPVGPPQGGPPPVDPSAN